jgi:acetyl esterase/lipase
MARFVVVIAFVAVFSAAPGGCAVLPAPARVGEWKIRAFDKNVRTELFLPPADAPGAGEKGRPAVVYLKNLPTPRIGQEADETIIADFLKCGYIVLTVDLQKNPKGVAPTINLDLWLMRRMIGRLFSGEKIDEDYVYILPEGYRLASDVTFYSKGKETFALDIMYPSRPSRPVPLLMHISIDNASRMSNAAAHWTYHDMMAECALTRGYAVAEVDNPLKVFLLFDPMPQTAYRLKAAVRTIRSKAKELGFDGEHIGVMGFSRSSGEAGILAMSAGMKELEGDGPHKEFSSRVQCAVLHAGRMDYLALVRQGHQLAKAYTDIWGDPVKNRSAWEAHSAISYVTADDPPTFLCTGDSDDFRTEQMRLMAGALKKAGVEHKLVVIPKMGHWVVNDVKVLGEIYDFLDAHLKPAARTHPADAE